MTKEMSASASSAMKIKVVAPDGIRHAEVLFQPSSQLEESTSPLS